MKRYFVAGLLIWIPIVITVWVLAWIVGTLDQTLLLLPSSMRPANVLGFHLPGLGVILSVAVVLLTGVVAANIIGQRLVRYWDSVLSRIPVVKSVY